MGRDVDVGRDAGRGARRGKLGWSLAFLLSLAVQLVVLYAPRAPSVSTGLPLDKVVHVAVFAAVAGTGLRAGLPARVLVTALLAHAVVSELIQAQWLAHRSGDVWDAVADAVGVGLGWAAVRTRAPRRP